MSDSKATLKVASQRLDQVSLPVLVAQGAGLSAEVAFRGRMHAVALLAHARELLGSFILLVEHARWPASTAVARCLFELAASGFYFLHKLKPALETADYDEALRVVNLAMSSSRLMNKYASPPWTESINVLTMVESLDKALVRKGVTSGRAQRSYSLLSEFSHPNAAALMLYLAVEGREVHIRESPLKVDPVPGAHIWLYAVLTSARDLLSLYGLDVCLVAHIDAILTTDSAVPLHPPTTP